MSGDRLGKFTIGKPKPAWGGGVFTARDDAEFPPLHPTNRVQAVRAVAEQAMAYAEKEHHA